MDNAPKRRTITLAGEEVEIYFSLASLHFITSKHPDLPEFLKSLTGVLNPKYCAEMIYAGLIVPDDEGNDSGPWSVGKIMGAVHPSELKAIMTEVIAAFMDGGKPVDPQ